MNLSESELTRYNRQILIKGWGLEGQRKLKNSKVAIVGIGGLGCLSALYLSAAGIGKLILIDSDKSSLNDLNRQILYSEQDLGYFKAKTAKKKLKNLNSKIVVKAIIDDITENNVFKIVDDADIVVDGLDNWTTRFIVNDCCIKKNIPFVHAGVTEFYGQLTTIMLKKGPCLRCIFPKEPPKVGVIPVFGATPAALASLQVMEVIKYLTGLGKLLIGRMLFLDGEEMTFDTVKIERNPNCPVCSFN